MRVVGVRRRPRRSPTTGQRLKRSVLIGSIVALAILAAVQGFLWLTWTQPRVTPTIKDAYYSSCRVLTDNGKGIGSGYLLNTGYVLTAGHNIDVNMDGQIELKERKVELQFFDSTGNYRSMEGWVIAFSRKPDYAVVQPAENVKSSIEFSLRRPPVGEKIYTIGCPRGRAIHLTTGYQSTPSSSRFSRASFSVYMGNSGGAVFTEEQKTVGIVAAVGIHKRETRIKILFPMQTKEGFNLAILSGNMKYFQTLPNWCEYVRNGDIYANLENKKLGFLVIPPAPWDGYCPAEPYARMSIQIFLVLLVVWALRKELFCA